MKLWLLPCVLGILAIVSGNLSFVVSILEGYERDCFPYLEGCASISASARHGLAAILFKLIVMPAMTLLFIYWLISWNYIKKISRRSILLVDLMLILGVIGSLFGILYTAFLGTEGNFYQLLRRFGIYLFFLGTYSAQILEISHLFTIKECRDLLSLKLMTIVSLLIGASILISIPSLLLIQEDNWLENVFEWNITFLIFFYFILSSLLWKKIQLKIGLFLNKF